MAFPEDTVMTKDQKIIRAKLGLLGTPPVKAAFR
jgi:hypothetical protein